MLPWSCIDQSAVHTISSGAYVPDSVLRSPANMSDDTTPSPFVASASSELVDPTAFGAWKAFDGDTSTFWSSATGSLPEWIKIDLGSAQYCASYKITARPTTFHYWVAWVLEGSADNSSWTTVDTQSGQSFSGGEEKTYTPATPQQFRYWRWTIASSQSSTNAEAASLKIFS